MKQILALALIAVFALSFVGCKKTENTASDIIDTTSSTPTESNEDVVLEESQPANTSSKVKSDKRIKKIVDESHKYLKTGNIVKFYEDDRYDYFTVSGENDGIMVHFKDGTKMGVVEAFENKLVTLSDLDKYDVKYIKEYSSWQIFDLTEVYNCNVKKIAQEFYRDKNFSYTFSTQKADYVKYSPIDEDKTWTVSEALKSGKIKPSYIDNMGVDFDKKYIGNKLLIVNESEGYATTQAFMEFYRDDDYKYEFSSGICVKVYYPDGTSQGVTEALKNGKIKVTDLNKFGIYYMKTRIANQKKTIIIADLTETGKYAVDDAEEEFYRDGKYAYLFPTQKSKYVIVQYGWDNTEQTVKEALAQGKIKISLLDEWDIDYIKRPIGK